MASRRESPTVTNPFSLLPLRTGVLFPGTVVTFPVGRDRSIALLKHCRKGDLLGVVTQKDSAAGEPRDGDVHAIGTVARVVDLGKLPDGTFRLALEGLGRLKVDVIVTCDPFWQAQGEVLAETSGDTVEAHALARALEAQMAQIPGGARIAGEEDVTADPGRYADRVAAALGLSTAQELRVIEATSVVDRLRIVSGLVTEVKTASEVKGKIDAEVRREVAKDQREAILREQLRAIKKELGEDRATDDLSALRERLEKAELSKEARDVATRELGRIEAMSPQQAEYNVIRTYLEWIADVPWSARAAAANDLEAVEKKLDADHFGLDDVKKRILEHMAVLQLKGEVRGSILCLAGPPGVGKTSLGQSIADATHRPFVRIALGGVRDEAEVRGHRRTYIGALPGRIVHAMKKAGVKNPVILLDEIDKLGVGWGGSPEAALLEVLDPEQNRTFTDHYLELPLDLSEVLFVCTANDLGNLSPPLRDRLEIIEVAGYTPEEKVNIARKHLVPKQLGAHAIHEGTLTLGDDALMAIVRDYTREAGVRQLERELKKLCRSLALEVARAKDSKPVLHIDAADLGRYLGRARFFDEVVERTQAPGVATGMAWTPVGGDILFIETSRMPGKGRVEITGQLGDVMKESARAALSYVKSHADELRIDISALEEQDLHIHVPAGGVPKDGPSAGVTMFTALTSLLSSRRVRSDTAMTGECTLRGRVLPVGGIKSKVLAAHRAGIKRVILPKRNERDLEEVPLETRNAVEFIFAEDMTQVIAAALEDTSVMPPEPIAARSLPRVFPVASA